LPYSCEASQWFKKDSFLLAGLMEDYTVLICRPEKKDGI